MGAVDSVIPTTDRCRRFLCLKSVPVRYILSRQATRSPHFRRSFSSLCRRASTGSTSTTTTPLLLRSLLRQSYVTYTLSSGNLGFAFPFGGDMTTVSSLGVSTSCHDDDLPWLCVIRRYSYRLRLIVRRVKKTILDGEVTSTWDSRSGRADVSPVQVLHRTDVEDKIPSYRLT